MPILDPVKNFAKTTLAAGINAADTSATVVSGAVFPNPDDDGAFNLVIWNATDYSNPTDDPNKEIVRCTDRATNVLTIVRAQEGTSAATHNTSGKTYAVANTPTAKLIADLNDLGNNQDFIDQFFANTSVQTYVTEIGGAGGAGGGIKILVDPTTYTKPDNTSENTVYTVPIKAGTLSTNNAIFFKILFSDFGLQNSPDEIKTIRLKYGGSTIATLQMGNSVLPGDLDYAGAHFEGCVIANAATNAQKAHLECVLGNGGTGDENIANSAYGTGAVDSTVDQDLVITVQSNIAVGGFVAEGIVVTKITGGGASGSFAAGVFTRAGNAASGNVVIPHGLSSAPSKVKVTVNAFDDGSAAVGWQSVGVYINGDVPNTATTWSFINETSGSLSGVDTTNIVSQTTIGSPASFQRAVCTVDDTNITLAFTRGDSGSSFDLQAVWEAEI